MYVAYAVLAYAIMVYAVTAYAMISLIQIQPVRRRYSNGEDSEAPSLSFSSSLCVDPVNHLDLPHLQVVHGVVRLAKVGCNWFFCFSCSYVRVVSVHPHV